MKKNLIFNTGILFICLAVMVFLAGVVFADTVITGTVGDSVVVIVEPSVTDFGVIPYGTDVTHSGSDIIINTTGSDTSSGGVNIDLSVIGNDSVFYSTLLELEEDGTSTWIDVTSLGTITMPRDAIKTYHTQLNGNTATHGAGPKNAVLVYTATADITQESDVARTISLISANPGEIINVNLSVSVYGEETFYAIEEYIPTGWAVINNGGGNTTNSSRLAWVSFDSAIDTVYSYSVQAPNQTGSYLFNGIYQFENFTEEKIILGDTIVTIN